MKENGAREREREKERRESLSEGEEEEQTEKLIPCLFFSFQKSTTITNTTTTTTTTKNNPGPAAILPLEALHGIAFAGSWAAGTEYISRLAPPGMKSTAQSLFSAAYGGVGAGAGALMSGSLYTSHGSDACFQGTASAVVAAWLGLSALEALVGDGQEGGTVEEEKAFIFDNDNGDNGGNGNNNNNNSGPRPRPLLPRNARTTPRPCSAIASSK